MIEEKNDDQPLVDNDNFQPEINQRENDVGDTDLSERESGYECLICHKAVNIEESYAINHELESTRNYHIELPNKWVIENNPIGSLSKDIIKFYQPQNLFDPQYVYGEMVEIDDGLPVMVRLTDEELEESSKYNSCVCMGISLCFIFLLLFFWY